MYAYAAVGTTGNNINVLVLAKLQEVLEDTSEIKRMVRRIASSQGNNLDDIEEDVVERPCSSVEALQDLEAMLGENKDKRRKLVSEMISLFPFKTSLPKMSSGELMLMVLLTIVSFSACHQHFHILQIGTYYRVFNLTFSHR